MSGAKFIWGLQRIVVAITFFCAASAVQAEVINIDNQQLKDLLAEDVTIVDVRRAEEWSDTGLVEGSELKTFFDARGKYDARKWLTELGDVLDPAKPVVLICHSGVRSMAIGKWLSGGAGFATVYNVKEGIVGWMKDGNPTVKPGE